MFDLLRKLVDINSEADRKDFIADLLKRKGISFYDDYNIYVPSRGKPRLFLDAHIDTVQRLSPFRENGEFFFGTGVADNLGNVSIMLQILLEKGNLSDVEFIFSVDEEEGGIGARKANPEAPCGIILEPTELKVWNRHKGAIEVLVKVEAEKSHGSYEGNFLNAILEKLLYYKSLEGKLNGIHVNLLYIKGGNESLYAAPDSGIAKFEIILAPEVRVKDVLPFIRDEVADFDEGFVENDLEFLPEVLKKLPRGVCPSWTNAIEYKKKGKKVVVFGAGNLYHCHTEREFLRKDELRDGYRLLKLAVED